MAEENSSGPPSAEEFPVAETASGEEASFGETLKARAQYHARQVIDHLWGPSGSVLLHLLLILALIRLVTFTTRQKEPEIEVMMVEPDAQDLEEFKKELEQLKEEQPDVKPPDAEITMEQPPDVESFDNAPDEDLAALDIRTDVQSPLIMKGLFAGRSAAGRSAALKRYAGRYADATESAVMRALEWLKEHQLDDGSWQGEDRASSKTAMTGLALLTFLAHGETPASEHFGKTVENAIKFLLDDLNLGNGSFKHVDGHWYAHGIASYALGEAYALTRIPSVKTAMDACVGRIVQGQQSTGAFNYNIRSGDTRRDTSVMGWMTQAMKAAYIAGADVPGLKEAIDKVANGFKLNYGAANNMFAYAPGGGGPPDNGRPSNTAMAVLCLQLIGHARDPETEAGLNSLAGMNCVWGDEGKAGNHTLYVWYYLTQAKFHKGKSVWENWNNQFAKALVGAQNNDGSWTPFSKGEEKYGPVYGTTFCALSLMVYYRFLPTYQPIAVEPEPTEKSTDDVKVEIL